MLLFLLGMKVITLMDDSEKRLISRYGLLIGSLLIFLFFFVFFLYLFAKGKVTQHYYQYSLLISGVLVILTRNKKSGKYFQIWCLIILSVVTIWTSPTQGYGIMLIFNLILLSKKYGFLRTKVIFKFVFSFILFVILLAVSLIANNLSLLNIFGPLLFFVISFISCSLILLDEIRAYFEMEKSYTLAKTETENLKATVAEISGFINPNECGLSETEMLLLESLCLHNESIKDLAIRLNKSHHTIKTQLKNIYDKIGVESKVELVKACENYFKIRIK